MFDLELSEDGYRLAQFHVDKLKYLSEIIPTGVQPDSDHHAKFRFS
jgi:hypothetical protein